MNSPSRRICKLDLNLLRISICLLLLLVMCSGSTGKQPTGASLIKPFDTYGNMCWEDEQARLITFAGQLEKAPDSVGYIIVYAGRHSCPDEAMFRAERAKKWLVKRGIKNDRVFIRDGGYREKVETVLFVNDKAAAEPEQNPTLKKDQVSIRRRCVDKTFAQVICLPSQ